MQAVIMAGGFGTRLRPLSCNIPKPMVPMVNKPMLYHIIALLKKHNFTELTMMLYFQPDVITNYFGDGSKFGVKIKYLRPEGDLGTAGSVKFAQKHINGTFLVISGDVLTDFDLTKAVEYHKHKKAEQHIFQATERKISPARQVQIASKNLSPQLPQIF